MKAELLYMMGPSKNMVSNVPSLASILGHYRSGVASVKDSHEWMCADEPWIMNTVGQFRHANVGCLKGGKKKSCCVVDVCLYAIPYENLCY